jgi:hypothetical protein
MTAARVGANLITILGIGVVLLGAVRQTMSPAHASLWLREQ